MECDLIISGGTLIDGTGADAVKADLAVKNGKIERIGDLSQDSAAETMRVREDSNTRLHRSSYSSGRSNWLGSIDEFVRSMASQPR